MYTFTGLEKTTTQATSTRSSTSKPTTDVSLFYKVSVSAWYFYGLVLLFCLTALCHPTEASCVVHGIWYLLCLPSGYLFLMIYSICNLTDRSWGEYCVPLKFVTVFSRGFGSRIRTFVFQVRKVLKTTLCLDSTNSLFSKRILVCKGLLGIIVLEVVFDGKFPFPVCGIACNIGTFVYAE